MQKSVKAVITALLCLAAITACSGKIKLPDANSSDARLYAERCGNCHAAYHPKQHDQAQWTRLFILLQRNIPHEGMEPLPISERTTILRYLKKYGRPVDTKY